nr:hypothetical protein [Candidatus Thioglobus sp.]
DNTLEISGVDTGNPENTVTDSLRVSGYGIQGNRTGLYITNASDGGNIQFGIGGNHAAETKMLIANSGRVGIGTTSPDKLLVVQGANAEIVINDTDTTDNPTLRFRESGTTSGTIRTDAGEMILSHSSAEAMRIDSSGNVGIGTSSPDAKLTVYGTSSDGWDSGLRLKREDGGDAAIVVDSAGMKFKTLVSGDNFYFRNYANATTLTILQDGNVGIGTTSPTEKLEVSGTVKATSFSGDGSNLSGIDALPSQTGSSGKYLGTDGSTATWSTVEAGMGYTEASSAPSSPTNGDIWLDTDDEILYQYQSSNWVQIADDGTVQGLGNLTTKGDIEAFSTTQERLAVGTNDQILTADSTATHGVAWKDAAGGGGVGGIETFTSSGTWNWANAGSPAKVWVTVVSGGGGGMHGNYEGSTNNGGGAGGVIWSREVSVSANVTVTVGGGGASGYYQYGKNAYNATAGGSSSFGSVSTGGGGGATTGSAGSGGSASGTGAVGGSSGGSGSSGSNWARYNYSDWGVKGAGGIKSGSGGVSGIVTVTW